MKISLRPSQTLVAAFAFLLPLLLGGCDQLPDLSKYFKPQGKTKFRTLDSNVASMAAPATAAAGSQTLDCRAGLGAAKFGKQWKDFNEAAFRLAPQSRVNVPLTPRKGGEQMAFQAMFDLEGQKLMFCPLVNGDPGDEVACSSIYALDDDLAAGIKRTFDIPDALRGGSITCAYDENNLKKL
jgi:hypothetical protein